MRRANPMMLIVAALIAGMPILSACQPQPTSMPTSTWTPGPPPVTVITMTPRPTAQVTATAPLPVGPSGPDSYPANVDPLTGLSVADPTVLNRAPLAIKVSNDPLARPQSGLSAADWVFEHYAEGAVTRLTAVYYAQAPEIAGSIRSGRLLDLEIVPMIDAIFCASGFSEGVRQRVERSSWASRNLSGQSLGEPYLVRIRREGLAEEHTLFAVPHELWKLATDRGVNNPPDLTPGLAFDPIAPPSDLVATHITIDYSPSSQYRVEWTYDPATGRYTRSIGGQPGIDYLTSQPVAVENVIAVGAMHVETDILEDGYNGLWSVEIQVWGEGPASLFRDGKRYEGHWTRLDPEQMLQFTDLNGNVLVFKPGQTWFEMVPIGFDRLYTEP